jgi:hypothetical protein
MSVGLYDGICDSAYQKFIVQPSKSWVQHEPHETELRPSWDLSTARKGREIIIEHIYKSGDLEIILA